MESIFPAPWSSLELSHVEHFLEDAVEEGLLWEAKGHTHPHHGSVRKAACGFANSRGGFLVIGAEHGDEGWTLPGVEFQVNEPGTWIASVVSDGLNPVPRFDVKVWDVDSRRKVVVLSVDPVDAPPCLTRDGVAYERTSGRTVRITDPIVLSRLTERGEAARANARRVAEHAARSLFFEPLVWDMSASVVSVSLAATESPPDRASRLFSEAFARDVFLDIAKRLQPDPYLRGQPRIEISRDALSAITVSPTEESAWSLRASWDGAVALLFSANDRGWAMEDIVRFLDRGWKTAVYLLEKLEEAGAAYLVALVQPRRFADPATTVEPTELCRWTHVRDPENVELASVERELRRDRGEFAWEPPRDP